MPILNFGNDLEELVKSQSAGGTLDIGESLGDAKLVVIRSTGSLAKHLARQQTTKTYSARQTAFLTVG